MKKLLLALFVIPLLSFGQTITTINFDTNSKWGGPGSGYGSYTYTDDLFLLTGTSIIKETSGITDGFPAFLGTYAFRLNNNTTGGSKAEFKIASGGVSTFSFKIRRWKAPSPVISVRYSVDGGTTYTSLPNIDQTLLTSSDWFTYSGVINSTETNIIIEVAKVSGERAMIDDFIWTDYTVTPTACTISAAGLTAVTCFDNGTPTVENDDAIKFSLNPTAVVNATTYNVTVPAGYTVSPTSASYGAATEFTLTKADGAAGAGDVVVTLTDATDVDCTINTTVTDPGICSAVTPILSSSVTTVPSWTYMFGSTVTSKNFTFSGLTLNNNVSVTAPTNFEISKNNIDFSTSLTFVLGTNTSMTDSIVHVRPLATAPIGTHAGDIEISSTDATTINVAVSASITGYTQYTITEATEIDAQGVSVKKDQFVEVRGVVHCMDFRAGSGYNMTMIDNSRNGIYVFRNRDITGYTNPVAGDSLIVRGKMDQFNGLVQVAVDTIILVSQGVPTLTPELVTVPLTYANSVNKTIRIEGLKLPDGTAVWPANGQNIIATKDGVNYAIRVTAGTDLTGTPAPQGLFAVEGIGSIFKTAAPFDSGFQILPCGTSSVFPEAPVVCSTVSDVITYDAETSLITATATGEDVTYKWYICTDDIGDQEILAETEQTLEVSVTAKYKVGIFRSGCPVVYSNCLLVDLDLSVSNALVNTSSIFPNPIKGTLNIVSENAISFTVIDVQGKMIVSNEAINGKATINTENWLQGVYFVELHSAKGEKHTLKVVK